MNSSSSSPFPSALAPSQPRQQEGLADGLDTPDPFKGLFDLPKTELAPGKAPAQGPSSSFQVCMKGNASTVYVLTLVCWNIPSGLSLCPSVETCHQLKQQQHLVDQLVDEIDRMLNWTAVTLLSDWFTLYQI